MVNPEAIIGNPETKNQPTAEIPKSREIFTGDINDAVVKVQQITGFEITPQWWGENVGNDGTTEEILDRFDEAFTAFVRTQLDTEKSGVETDDADATLAEQIEVVETELKSFDEKFGTSPEVAPLRAEFLEALEKHLKERYFALGPAAELRGNPEGNEVASSRLDAILQQFTDDKTHSLLQVGDPKAGIEFIGLGDLEATESLASSARLATERLQKYFGGKLAESFPGLKIYFGDGIIEGGGEALAEENAIIIDAAKGKMTVAEVESFLVGIGSLDEGDWTKVTTPDVTYAEITIVHELGHLLEAKAHGKEGIAFAALSHDNAPTKYGREADHKEGPNNEDYPESLVYDIYSGEIDAVRKTILHNDVRQVSGT